MSDEFWKRTIEYFAAVPELNYMTQIVLMLYEDPQAEQNSEKRFHIELHFSPGVKCHLEEAAKDSRFNMLNVVHKPHNKDVAFLPTDSKTQIESRQGDRSGSEHSASVSKEHKNAAATLIEEESETTQADSFQEEHKNSTGVIEKLSPNSPTAETTGPDGFLVEGPEEKRDIISRRQKCGRSQSECEYSAKILENLAVADGNMKNKAFSKSMGESQ